MQSLINKGNGHIHNAHTGYEYAAVTKGKKIQHFVDVYCVDTGEDLDSIPFSNKEDAIAFMVADCLSDIDVVTKEPLRHLLKTTVANKLVNAYWLDKQVDYVVSAWEHMGYLNIIYTEVDNDLYHALSVTPTMTIYCGDSSTRGLYGLTRDLYNRTTPQKLPKEFL